MRSPLRRVRTFLRSPRLAAWLLVWVSAYVVASTAVPQTPQVTTEELVRWQGANPLAADVARALGLHNAFVSVLFLVPALLLTLSTAVCAWNRYRAGAVLHNLRKRTQPNMLDRLARAPSFSLDLPGDDPERVLDQASVVLGASRLDLARRGDVLVASSHLHAAFGSALFHWALAGLFLVAGFGQLVKWEGQIGILVGHSVTDKRGSYGWLAEGPWAGEPSTGYDIELSEMDVGYVADDVERGHAPLVRLLDGDTVVAEGLVYPNSPLRHGRLYIHRGEWGVGVATSIVTSSGEELAKQNFLFDFVSSRDGRIAIETDVPSRLGVERIILELPLDDASGGRYRADLPADPRVEVRSLGASGTTTSVLRVGDTLSYPGGSLRLRVDDITRYTRLFVVDDPTILWVYALFVLAMIGCAVALLTRPRAVLARAESLEGGIVRLNVLVVAKRIDPLFMERVQEALSSRFSSEGES